MTSPDDSSAPRQSGQSGQDDDGGFADRVYRSPGAMVGGVLLLALGAWLGIDALVRGEGRTPWVALSGLLFAVPVVVAFTLRPAVYAGSDRLRVRNPFRTITLPWASVESVRAGYTSEVLAGGATYQLWSIPVSLRQRKQANKRQVRAAVEDPFGGTSVHGADAGGGSQKAASDQAIEDLRELAEAHSRREGAQGEPQVRWAFEVIAPAVAGAVLLVVMLSLG